jgi:hypothetical protein
VRGGRRFATQPLGPVGLGAGPIRAIRYVQDPRECPGHR